MKPKLSLKTLYRSPVRTVLTFILLAAVTFALFSQVLEYSNTKKEFEENVEMYYGTGKVEASPAEYKNTEYPYYIEADPRVDAFPAEYYNEMRYDPITQEQIDTILAMPPVSSSYKRYMTGGIVEEFYRISDYNDNYDYAARLIIEGTFKEIKAPGDFGFYVGPTKGGFYLDDCEIIAGQADIENLLWPHSESTLGISYRAIPLSEDSMLQSPPIGKWQEGLRWGGANGTPTTSVQTYSYKYVPEYLSENLEVGRRYVMVLRFNRAEPEDQDYNVQYAYMSLYDFLTEPWCQAIWDVTDAPENYLELEEYAPLRQCVEITNADVHTLDVVYTDNMEVIQQIDNDVMRITEGRWLNAYDTENSAPVCVISETFAKANNLKIGDRMSLKLGDELFEQYYGLGAVAVTPERYADNWTEKTEFEIVGIYTDQDGYGLSRNPNWTYSANTVFVPLSFLPVSDEKLANHEFAPSEFNFRVDNAWEIEAFVEEYIPQIENMGLTVMFEDGGWMEVVQGYRDAQSLSMIRIVLLICVTALATGFVVYLFISRKKKDYAIMRALGTTKRDSARSLLLPFMVLGVTGTAAGAILGMAQTTAAGSAVLPIPTVICIGGEILLMLAFSSVTLYRLGKMSVLSLLQGNQTGNRKKVTAVSAPVIKTEEITPKRDTAELSYSNIQPREKVRRRPRSVRFVLKYVFRHIRRSPLKSFLAVLLAVLMICAITQFSHMKDVYMDLRVKTVITPRFVNACPLYEVAGLKANGYAEDLYYGDTSEADILYGTEHTKIHCAVTNNISRYTNEEYKITYLNGYDESCMDSFGDILIVGDGLMELCGFELGDTVRITPDKYMDEVLLFNVRRYFWAEYPDLILTNEALYEKYGEYIEDNLEEKADVFTIVGVISTPSGAYGEMVFTPGKLDGLATLGTGIVLDMMDFRLADNTLAKEMLEYGKEISKNTRGAFIMDTSKLESVIRTSELLNALYPVAVASAIVIGAFLCILIIFQTQKEVAVMRVLGTSKKKTRAVLVTEQAVLTFVGIVLGALVMYLVNRVFTEGNTVFAGTYFSAVIIAAYASAVMVTRKNVLELLQTKE